MTTFQQPQTLQNWQFEDDRTGLSVETLKRALADNLFYIQGKFPAYTLRSEQEAAIAAYYRAIGEKQV
ncbi:hypothetical protein ACWATR_32585 [Nostoc sp. UIC 10890]